eukprot:Hpha_TRINITY_DN37025_c0_g1::TRINITY_DN37025_c0_g1_i1::g.83143::m.83143
MEWEKGFHLRGGLGGKGGKCHLTAPMKQAFSDAKTVLAVIPGGMTQFQQMLDVVVFHSWVSHYVRDLDEFLYRRESKAQLTASEKRVAMTMVVNSAFQKSRASVQVAKWFVDLGYTGWKEDPEGKRLRLRGFPQFRFSDIDPDQFGVISKEANSAAKLAVDKAFPPSLSPRATAANA